MTAPDFEPDAEPLADALREIAAITDASESDPRVMREMLWRIQELIEAKMVIYRNNIKEAQKAEIAYLRKQRA
jgi:hypothetical protein